MNKMILTIIMLFALVISGCVNTLEDKNNSGSEPKACTADAKICADGSAVGRDGNNNCEFTACPDEKTYITRDPEKCKVIKFMCVQGKQPFSDDTGCGCEPVIETPNSGDGKLQAIDCIDPRPSACTKEYMPVCGQVQVQCIRAPCPPIKETFANKCDACANSLTISYTNGACDTGVAGGTVPADTPTSTLCADAGGKWIDSAKECEGLTQNHCTELGGTFNECASACRNDPNAQVCTMQCVQVCQFKLA